MSARGHQPVFDKGASRQKKSFSSMMNLNEALYGSGGRISKQSNVSKSNI